MIDFLKRLRRLWLLSARPHDPNSFQALLAEGVIEMGAHSYGEPHVVVWRSPIRGRMGSRVIVGRYCSIAGGVTIMTGGNHRTDFVSTYSFRARWNMEGRDFDNQTNAKGDVVIGDDVWIGQNASILSGVTIGPGAVVAAFSVVTKDVLPYVIVAGNPARPVRQRFRQEEIDALLEVAWWDLPTAVVRQLAPILNGGTVDELISAVGTRRVE